MFSLLQLTPFQLFTNLKSKGTEVDTLKDQIEVVNFEHNPL